MRRSDRWSASQRAVAVLVAYVLFYALVSPAAWFLHGFGGLWALAGATAVCLVASLLSLWLTSWLTKPRQVAWHVGLGMLLRMGLPLAFCLWTVAARHAWVEAGFPFYLIAAFLLGLTCDTVLMVRHLQQDQQSVGTPHAADRGLAAGNIEPSGGS